MTVSRDRVFADIIPSIDGIILDEGGLSSRDSVLVREAATQGRRPCEGRGRDRGDAPASHAMR